MRGSEAVFLRVLCFLSLVFGSTVAMAAPSGPVPIRIDLQGPAGCSGADAFFERIHARTDRVHLAVDGEDGIRLRVRLTRAGAKVFGELRILDDKGETDTRKMEGATCDEVVEALSLTAALALDPAARTSVTPTPPPSVPQTAPSTSSAPPNASAPVPGASTSSPSPAAPTPQQPPVPTPSPSTTAAPPSPIPLPGGPPATIAPASGSPRITVAVGAHAVVTEVVSPYANVGGTIFVRLTRDTGGALSPSVGVALVYAANDLVQTPDVAVRWTAIALSLCPVRFDLGAAVRVAPCALGIGGWLAATEGAVSHPDSALRSWWSIGAVLRAAVALSSGLSFELEGGATVPLLARSFVTTIPDVTVGQTPALSALGSIGVAYEF